MGVNVFYLEALQKTAAVLYSAKDNELSAELVNEQSIEKLESIIIELMDNTSEREFYYFAGRTTEYLLIKAEEEGSEALCACREGLIDFYDLIDIVIPGEA